MVIVKKSIILLACIFIYTLGKADYASPDSEIARNLYKKALSYKNLKADSILLYLDSCKQYFDTTKNILLKHKCDLLYAEAHRKKGNFAKMLEYVSNCQSFFNEHNMDYEIAECNYFWGIYYSENSNIEESSNYLSKAIQIYDSIGSKYDYYKTLNAVATNMFYLTNYKLANRIFKEIYEYAKEQKDTAFLGMSLNNLAVIYSSKKFRNDSSKLDSALYYYKESLKISRKLKNNYSIANTLMNISLIYSDRKQYIQALDFLNKAEYYNHGLDDVLTIYINFNKGIIHSYLNKNELSINYFSLAIEKANSINHIGLLADINLFMSEVYKKQGNFKKALEKSEVAHFWRDSIWEQNLLNVTTDVELRYHNKQKANELNLKQALIEKQKSKLKTQQIRNLAIAVLAHMFLILFIVIYVYSKKLKKINLHLKQKNSIINNNNTELKETVDTKDQLISIIAHDIKNPLSTIAGFAELIVEGNEKEEVQMKSYAEHIMHAATSLFDLLENLLKWAQAQKKSINLEPSIHSLKELIDTNICLLEHTANSKQIKISSKCIEELKIIADKPTIQTVFRNILSNALKFTPEGGNIQITCGIQSTYCFISIKDNGIGIKEEDIPKLFDSGANRKKIGSNSNKGFGLGLLLCNEFIKLNNGKIKVESEPGKGSNFIIYIPSAN